MATIRTRKFITNRILNRRQMVVDIIHPVSIPESRFPLLRFYIDFNKLPLDFATLCCSIIDLCSLHSV